ncbi:hypothetical protein A8B73_21710 [Methylosinus sp. 3S-1]|nr:hypothetical protein A8B73_21710 [Methylosinus sp. 3S-1]
MRGRENVLHIFLIKSEHPLKQAAEQRTIVGQNGVVAILEQMPLIDVYLFAHDATASDATAEHPIDTAVTVVGSTTPILSKSAPELRQDNDDSIIPLRADLLRKTLETSPKFADSVCEIAVGRSLVCMRVPAAYVDKAQIKPITHQTTDTVRRKLEVFRYGNGSAWLCLLLDNRLIDFIADAKTFLHLLRESAIRVHRGDKFLLARIDAGLAEVVDRKIGNRVAAMKCEGHLIGE